MIEQAKTGFILILTGIVIFLKMSAPICENIKETEKTKQTEKSDLEISAKKAILKVTGENKDCNYDLLFNDLILKNSKVSEVRKENIKENEIFSDEIGIEPFNLEYIYYGRRLEFFNIKTNFFIDGVYNRKYNEASINLSYKTNFF